MPCARGCPFQPPPRGDLDEFEFEFFFAESDVSTAAFGGTAESIGRLRSIKPDPWAVGRLTGEVSWVETSGPVTLDVTLAPSAA